MYCDQTDEHKNVLNINYIMLNRLIVFYIHQIVGNNIVGMLIICIDINSKRLV